MKSFAHPHAVVLIGSTFDIRDLHSNELETYTLTRPSDANISLNRISSLGPVGRALYGRHPGEIVEVDAPGGTFHFRIEAIEHGPEEQLARAG